VRPVRPVTAAPLVADPDPAAVIAHRGGPLLVIGAPGTGKTTTLVEAVAARVADGASPDRILVLTFGRRGALRLRDRISARLGAAGVPDAPDAAGDVPGAAPDVPAGRLASMAEPMVRTFHGYAFGLLRRAAADAGRPTPRLLTGPEQDLVIRELLDDVDLDPAGWPEALRPALRTRAFATELRDLLLRCAERGVGPEGLARLAEARRREDWAAAAGFFRQYLQVLGLREAAAGGQVGYDYAELVRAATGLLLDDPGLLAAERRRLCCVYVDELADTDPAQIDLLAAVAGHGADLVAFADPDSSTFTFRGADPGIVAGFADRFPRVPSGDPAPRITLTRSYRSGDDLLAATRRVATRLRGPSRHRAVGSLTSSLAPLAGVGAGRGAVEAGAGAGGAAAGPEVVTFRSDAVEAAFVAHRLREAHLLHGVPWGRMAVIVRSTQLQLAWIRRALVQAGVPATTAADDLPLHLQPAVAPLLLALRCALEPERIDEQTATALLHSPLVPLTRLPSDGCDRDCGPWRSPRGTGPRPGCCWSRRCAIRAGSRRSRSGGGPPPRSGSARSSPRCGNGRRGRARAPRARCGRPGRPRGSASGGPRRPPAVASAARLPTGTSTRWWRCSTRRPGSPTGCPARVPRSSPTTSRARTCPPTRWPRSPSAGRPCASSRRTPPRDWSGTWSWWPASRRASGLTCGCAVACSGPTSWST
jgi:superfamily I DNA/RNA helicase